MDRVTLKARGKSAFLSNYWKCVLVGFIMTLFVGGTGNSIRLNFNGNSSVSEVLRSFQVSGGSIIDTIGGLVLGGMVVVSLILAVIRILLNIFIFSPLEVGGYGFFADNTHEPASPGRIMCAFQNGSYGRTVVTLFFRDLYIFLWSLLLVIPGIIKGYEYRMIPYLLAEYPEMSREELFRESKRMMYGCKFEAFVLDLSFIGWELLSALTFGLVGIFYVSPYRRATNAELYYELKRR